MNTFPDQSSRSAMHITRGNEDLMIKTKTSRRIIWNMLFFFYIRENLICSLLSIKLEQKLLFEH